MKRMIIVCAWLAAAAAASSCSGDGIGPARPVFDPFGTESSGGGSDPGGGGGETLLDLCGRACANIASTCAEGGDADCPSECASDVPAGCEAEYRAFVQCIATATFMCIDGSIDATPCLAVLLAVSQCDSSGSGSGTGGTGAAPSR